MSIVYRPGCVFAHACARPITAPAGTSGRIATARFDDDLSRRRSATARRSRSRAERNSAVLGSWIADLLCAESAGRHADTAARIAATRAGTARHTATLLGNDDQVLVDVRPADLLLVGRRGSRVGWLRGIPAELLGARTTER